MAEISRWPRRVVFGWSWGYESPAAAAAALGTAYTLAARELDFILPREPMLMSSCVLAAFQRPCACKCWSDLRCAEDDIDRNQMLQAHHTSSVTSSLARTLAHTNHRDSLSTPSIYTATRAPSYLIEVLIWESRGTIARRAHARARFMLQ